MEIMEFPPITILMTTYAPPGPIGESTAKAAEYTVDTWKNKMLYKGKLNLHIADDGSEIEFWKSFNWNRGILTSSRQERGGVGASLNIGLHQAFLSSPFVIYPMDDWALREKFDLTPWVEILLNHEDIGAVRLGPPHPICGSAELAPEGEWILRLERYNYAFSLRPILLHKRLIDSYGWFEEKCDVEECEKRYNDRFCSQKGPDIALALFHPWEWVYQVNGYPRPSLAGIQANPVFFHYRCKKGHEFDWPQEENLESCRFILKNTPDYWDNICGEILEKV